ncbi:hypothetical protein JZ751_015254 [Albula glossodonta]|uniref:CCD97-like C-terminal domain-containing protein n=1 Tax=Albula glossodonta TaxID=121402 RepID=A0A8T2NU41_9TELE|nr:hypothetical protein JZ751_015254 [Albula glossodonta]
MWGEIEPYPTSCPINSSCKEELHSPVSGLIKSESADKEQQKEYEGVQNDCPSSLSAMIETVAASGSPVKSQQLGEPDLTVEERKQVLLEQYKSKPLVFLERYQMHLKPEHLGAFAHLSTDCRAQHYCKEVQRRATNQTNRTRVRNHRYAALRALQQGGWEQDHSTSTYTTANRSEEAMAAGAGGLADLLMNSYQEKLIQQQLQKQQDREDGALEESEEEDGKGGGKGKGGVQILPGEGGEEEEDKWEPSAEEKALLREEFVSQMHQRFLDGKDKDFNYSEVDENPDYDNLDIVSRDAEERYFDDDDDEEEEEDEDAELEEDDKME